MNQPASNRFLASAFAIVAVVFVILYFPAFGVLPAADDFGYITEIHRGNREGVAVFFTKSVTDMSYRPLTSLGLWAFGNAFGEHPTVGIRVLHLLSALAYGGVVAMWARTMSLGRVGATVAIATVLLQPSMPAAVGSIDGFNSLLSSAMLWLGAWAIVRWRDRPALAVMVAAGALVLGIGFKEYAFAMPLVVLLAIACLWKPGVRVKWIILTCAALGLIVLGAVAVRKLTLPAGAHGGWGYLSLNPTELLRDVVRNAVLLFIGLMFFGDTLWAYVHRSPAVILLVGAWMFIFAAVAAWGIALRVAAWRARESESESDPLLRPLRWTVFLVLGIVAATFPAIVTVHVSEMYVPPMVLPLALLLGMAGDGFFGHVGAERNAGTFVRAVAGTVTAVALAWSVVAIRNKVSGLVDVGRRADRQIQQVLSLLPPDAHDMVIELRYLHLPYRRDTVYGVYRMPENFLLVHDTVLDWPRPGKNLRVSVETYNNHIELQYEGFDLILAFNNERLAFEKLWARGDERR